VKWFERKALKSLFLNIGEVLRTPLIAKWVSEADTVITVSKRHAELLAKALPPLKDKLIIVYNPPPPIPKIKKEPAETPVFLYMGGESYIKGFHVLIQAVELALRERAKAKFVFANEYGSQAQRIILKINKVYGEVIYLTGKIPHTEVLNLYKRAWALLFPSICEEPLPYVVMEAILTLTIPISSKIGGVPELIISRGLRSLIFEPGSVKMLYDRIAFISNIDRKEVLNYISYLDENSVYILREFKPLIEDFEELFMGFKI
jgi:glycosyltransferase involved in cell wall biosynthesis